MIFDMTLGFINGLILGTTLALFITLIYTILS